MWRVELETGVRRIPPISASLSLRIQFPAVARLPFLAAHCAFRPRPKSRLRSQLRRGPWMKLAPKSSVRAMCMAGLALLLAGASNVSLAQQRREREPNEVYTARRARVAAQTDAP